MFSVKEKVVYPGYGVAEVSQIIEKTIAGSVVKLYELSFLSKDVKVLVPVDHAERVGIRLLSSAENVAHIFTLLAKSQANRRASMSWNRRTKGYQAKIRSGSLEEITQVYQDLKNLEVAKGLSFGEKKLLSETEMLLAEEIALVSQKTEDSVLTELRRSCNSFNIAHNDR